MTTDLELRVRLYVVGDSPRSRMARKHLESLVNGALAGAAVEVVDILESPGRAEADGILASPTLVAETAEGHRTRIVGDLSERERVLGALGLDEEGGDR